MESRSKLTITTAQEVPIDLLEEDVNQPRTFFDQDSLNELANSIKSRGVKTPISIRVNNKTGKYTINHGHRRFRASILAGKKTIPAYIDNNYNDEDQVIENVHRQDLTPREIADYIGRQSARGKSQKTIAQELSKSNAWVSLYAKLLNLPDCIADIFHSGRCVDVFVIQILVTAYNYDPIETSNWLIKNKEEKISRRSAQSLKDFLEYNKKLQEHDKSFQELTTQRPLIERKPKINSEKNSRNKKSNEFSPLKALETIWKHNYKESYLVEIFSPNEIKKIKDYLFIQYKRGKKENKEITNILQYILNGESLKGSGAYLFTSFLFGMEKKNFDFAMIIDQIFNLRSSTT